MLDNASHRPDFNPFEHELLRSLQRPFQYELAEQGIDASPEEAYNLFELKIVHDAKRAIQRDLAEQGIDVSPDEAVALQGLYLMMGRIDTTDPNEAK